MFYSERLHLSLIVVLGGAAILDFLLADPWGWPHPVQVMGWVIDQGKKWILATTDASASQRMMGVLLAGGVIVGSGLVGGMMVMLGSHIHVVLGGSLATVLLASCFAGRGLRRAAEDVLGLLNPGLVAGGPGGAEVSVSGCGEACRDGWLDAARDRLKLYVGRDTANLSEQDIYRAVFETVTENAIDGVLAPLFYAGLGALAGQWIVGIQPEWTQAAPVMAVAVALAYKAASTLDSMVGYREAPYTDLGWFSAKFEDGLTWLPCRTAVLCIALLSGQPYRVLRICWRDARTDPSPNAGWSECVYAAALGVQVGGDNYYRGVLKTKPLLGDDDQPISIERIRRALALTRLCFLLWLVGICGLLRLLV